jgi:hypothetical protein
MTAIFPGKCEKTKIINAEGGQKNKETFLNCTS